MEKQIKINEVPIKYYCNDLGDIITYNWKNTGNKSILKPAIDKKGYKRVGLQINGKLTTHKVHRLIALMFIGNDNNYPCVNHINGIKIDNRVENLEWCTYKQNTQHSYDNKLQVSKKGDEHHRTKYLDEFVLLLKKELDLGISKREISRKYKVDRSIFKRKVLSDNNTNT
jgi:hypothetical protein